MPPSKPPCRAVVPRSVAVSHELGDLLVARAAELTDALRSNKATRATGVADLHAALAAAHRPAKRAQPKKQRKLKYRGARLLKRYRERPI